MSRREPRQAMGCFEGEGFAEVDEHQGSSNSGDVVPKLGAGIAGKVGNVSGGNNKVSYADRFSLAGQNDIRIQTLVGRRRSARLSRLRPEVCRTSHSGCR